MLAFRRNPFFGPLLATLAGMSFEALLPGTPTSYWPAAILLAPAALGWRLLRREAQLCVLAIGAFFAGGLWLSLHPLAIAPPTNASPGERVQVAGCVDAPPRTSAERVQFRLATPEGFRIQASIYLREGETAPALQVGQPVLAEGRIRPPRNFRNPGSFDYERYLARQDTYWLLTATGVENFRPVDSGQASCGNPALAAIHRVRTALLEKLRGRFEEGSAARAYLAAILFGDDSGLAEETLEQYRLAGVYHVLVISGQHIAILAGAILLLARLLAAPRWLGYLLTALCCWAYTLVAGYEVPALRAAFGISLYLVGSLGFRRARPLNLLSLIALIFLAWDPRQLLDASFQLSFLAVFSIAGVAAPLQRRLFGEWPQIGRSLKDTARDFRLSPWVAEARIEIRLLAKTLSLATRIPEAFWLAAGAIVVHSVAVIGSLLLLSCVVQAMLSPLLVHDFHRVSVAGPLANLALSPMLGILVPLAFVDLLAGLPWGPDLVEGLVGATNGTVAFFASLAPDLRTPDVPPLLLLLAAMVAALLAIETEPLARPLSASERREVQTGRPARYGVASPAASRQGGFRLGRRKFPLLLVSGAALLLFLVVHPFQAHTSLGYWEITMLDVGQGDSALMVTPAGKTVLIDTGGLGAYASESRLDTGEDVVAPYLWSRGIQRLHLLVLTHLDYDHAGGAAAILRIFRPAELWVPIAPRDHPLWEEIRTTASELGIPIVVRKSGERVVVDDLVFHVLHPSAAQEADRASNEVSLVLDCRFGERSAVFTGDIDRVGELEMARNGVLRRAEILKVAHHGSRTSTTETFVDTVQPKVALISAGWLNSYRHPHPDVLQRLRNHHSAIFRSDLDGGITLRTDGSRWELRPPDGRSVP